MDDLTAVVPFWNGHAHIERLLDSLPDGLPVVVVDDVSDEPLQLDRPGTQVIRLPRRGYFAGAVNAGIEACKTDVLVINQDAALTGTAALDLVADKRETYAVIGEGVMRHPAWPAGYVQGTFMYISRDAWREVGQFNRRDYPLWGCTCEWQLRACRAGHRALPLQAVPGFKHGDDRDTVTFHMRGGGERHREFGEAIAEAIRREPKRTALFTQTPPLVSVVVPCFNYGHYLKDAIHSLVGGETCLGHTDGQTLKSFEVIIVDDASTDDSWDVIQRFVDPWIGIRAIRHPENRGCPAALNTGVRAAHGRYIHVLSADDMREPWCLERLVRACQANEHHVAYGDIRVLKHGRGKRLRMRQYNFDTLLHKNMLPAGIMYPKRAWEDADGYPTEMSGGREDWAFAIALGIAGWCGVHVGDSGNLVRREGQNRSLRTARAGLVPEFKRQLMALYPRVYGGERPMGCCGGRRTSGARTTTAAPRSRPARIERVGGAGMVEIEYLGGNTGDMRFTGKYTGQTYVFGDNDRHRVQFVDRRDLKAFLALRHNQRPLFRRYQRPKPPEVPDLPTPPLTDVSGVGEATAEKMRAAGIADTRVLAAADPGRLAEAVSGIGASQAEAMVDAAKELLRNA